MNALDRKMFSRGYANGTPNSTIQVKPFDPIYSNRDIINRIIMAESSGDPSADSGHAKGLMQIKDTTADDPGINFADGTPVQPVRREGPNGEISAQENVRFGTDYFDALTDRYGGDLVTAAMAYNSGPTAIDNWIANGRKYEELRGETQDYIGKIFGQNVQQQVKDGTYKQQASPTAQERLDSLPFPGQLPPYQEPPQTNYDFNPSTMISAESRTYAPRIKNPEMTFRSSSKVPKPLEIYDKKTDTMYQLNDDFIKSLLFEGANVFSILKEDSTKGGSLVFGSQVAEQLEKYREENEFLNLSRRSFDLLDARDVGTIGTDTLGRLGIITEPLFRSLAGFVGETNILPGSQKLRSLDDKTNLFGGFLPGIPFQEKGTSYILSDRERAIKALNNMMDVSGGKARSDIQMNPYAESDLRDRLAIDGFDLDMLMPGPNFNPEEQKRYKDFIASKEATEDPLSESSIASDIEELETASSAETMDATTAPLKSGGFEFLKNLKPPRANSIEDSINEITAEATKPPVNSALKDIEEEEIVIEDSGKIDENGKNILIKPTIGQEGEIILSEEGNITQSDDDGNIIVSNNQGEVISVNGETPEISTENINENTISSFSQSPVAKSLQSGMSLGASLADMFQKISAVPNVKNTLDLLQGGAQTYSALNLAEEAAEKKDTRAYQTALAKEIAKARSEINKPLSVTENARLTESSLEVDQAVTDFKNASQNLALIDQLIEISKDPDIKGWRGFIGKLTTKTEAFLAAGGETPKSFDELPPRVQFEKLMTIVSQKNIKEILNETGKTISNIDRDIVDRIMGKITVFTDPAETLKALQLAREDSLKNLESYRNKGRTLLGFLKEYGKVPGSAQTETDILEQLINFDRKTYRSNLTNENFTSGAGVSYAGTPVYNLSGQKISD